MNDYLNITAFLEPVAIQEIAGDTSYKHNQFGNTLVKFETEFPDLATIDLVIVGCGERRGSGIIGHSTNTPDIIRKQFYQLFYWHQDISLADIGNIKPGKTYKDTLAALKTVVQELTTLGKTVIILGGSHDLTTAQYAAYKNSEQVIDATVVDALIDLDMESPFMNDHFLMDILTGEPNYIRHYNHVGFQSYLVHPGMLQTLDKLKFDCYRVGHVKENIEEIEPVIRNSQLFSFDINAIAYAYAPTNQLTPNGLSGEEACILMQYAGLSNETNTIGIYGYDPSNDVNDLTAKQISQMLWYTIDGRYKRLREASTDNLDEFNIYEMIFAEVATTFIQSKKTGRWWMQLPDKAYAPCSYNDYLLASSNEIPERWFRAQQRSFIPNN